MKIPADWLGLIMEQAQQQFGMNYQLEQSADLLCRLKWRAEELQISDCKAWIQQAAQSVWSRQLLQELLPVFTVGETYFCRDPLVTQWLIQQWLPEKLSQSTIPLSIWSAGCCRGEEAYSLLFMLSEALAGAQSQTAVQVLATDLNPEFIAKAERGIYRATSFRNGTEQFKQRYFSALAHQHQCWQVKTAWRSLIKFKPLNLIDPQWPAAGPFDLIFCRNVLMYFSPDQARKTITRFLQQLKPGGLLLLNAVEATIANQAGYSGFWAADNYALPATALQRTVPLGFGQFAASDVAAVSSFLEQNAAVMTVVTPIATPANLNRPLQQLSQPQLLPPFLTRHRPDRLPQQLAVQYLQQAKQAADLHQLVQARAWLTKLLTQAPMSAAGYLLSAQVYSQEHQPQLALQALQKAIYLEPDLIVAHLLKAQLALDAGQQKTARKELQLCTQLLQHCPAALEIPHSEHLSAGQLYLICQQLIMEVS